MAKVAATMSLGFVVGVGTIAHAEDKPKRSTPHVELKQPDRPSELIERRASLRLFGDQPKADLLRSMLNEARRLVDMGELDLGLKHYAQLTQVSKDGWLYVEVGATLAWYGRYNEALAYLEEGLSKEPFSFQGILGMAVTRDALGQTAEAMRLYKRALMIRPDNYDARFNLGRLQYAQGQLEQAESTYRDLIGRRGEDWKSLNNLGLVLLERGQPTAAIAPLRRALKLKPKDPGLLYNMGRAHAARNEQTRALSYYDRALKGWGADDIAAVSLHFARGNALFVLRRYKEAAEAFGQAHALDPDSSNVLLNLGAALANQGRYEEAIEALESAVDNTPRPSQVYHQIALCYMYDDKLDAALKSLEQARALNDQDPETWELLSQVHDARGDEKASTQALAEACRLGSKRSCR
ncbi:MAG: tetratricopeptide repeat protein [Myxococcota bacterium]